MLGLIKKDLFLIKANLKSMMIVFVVYAILVLQGVLDVTLIVPIMGIMLFITTFSYDDFNHWDAYAVTLPHGRKNVVKAKYIASMILVMMLAIISLILAIGVHYIKSNDIRLDDILSSLIGTMLSNVIIISLLYPIVFKFGATRGRMILFAVVFAIVGIITILSRSIDMTFMINMINQLDRHLWLIPMVSAILLGLSYLISDKIYQNKEF